MRTSRLCGISETVARIQPMTRRRTSGCSSEEVVSIIPLRRKPAPLIKADSSNDKVGCVVIAALLNPVQRNVVNVCGIEIERLAEMKVGDVPWTS